MRVTGLHAEAKPIFTLVAYRRIAKLPHNQTERTGGNSYEDRAHNRDPYGRELELPELIGPIGTNTNPAVVSQSEFFRLYAVRVPDTKGF